MVAEPRQEASVLPREGGRPIHHGWREPELLAWLERQVVVRHTGNGIALEVPIVQAALEAYRQATGRLDEDLLAAGILRIVERARSYDGRRSAPSTWVWQQAQWGAADHLIGERRQSGLERAYTEGLDGEPTLRPEVERAAREAADPSPRAFFGLPRDWLAEGWGVGDLLPALGGLPHAVRVLEAVSWLADRGRRPTLEALADRSGLSVKQVRRVRSEIERRAKRYAVAFLLASGVAVGEEARRIAQDEGIPVPEPRERQARREAFTSASGGREALQQAVAALAAAKGPVEAMPWP